MKTRLLIIIGITITVISAIAVGFFTLSSDDQQYSKENPYGFSAHVFYDPHFLPIMCPIQTDDCGTHLQLSIRSDVPAILQGYKICSGFSCVSQDHMQFSTKDSGIIPIFDGNKWNVGDKISLKVQVVTEYDKGITHSQPEPFYIDLGESEIAEDGFNAEPDSKVNVMCMTLEKSKDTATFFKIPSYLPDGYSFKCSFSGTPYESYMIFHNKKVPDGWISNYPELISDGAIFIFQTDEKRLVGEKEFAIYGSATQRIQDTYDGVMVENPSLHPQLIQINGMLAYAVDSCNDCGIQTANFTDGTVIQKHTSAETKIKFIDENGVKYSLQAGIPLNELIKVAESLQ